MTKKQNDDNMPEGEGPRKAGRSKRPLERAMPLNDAHLMESKRQCPAISKRTGERCKRYCALGMRSCRWHGSATRVAKTAAAKRIAQASGYAADMLAEFMADPGVPLELRTKIAQDLLNRAGVSEKTVLQIGVEQPKSFLDFVGEAIVDVTDDDPNVIEAEVIEDDTAPLVPRDPDEGNRFDRAAFAEVERARATQRAVRPSEGRSRAEMLAAERAALGLAEDDGESAEAEAPSHQMSREQLLLAKESGYNFSSRGTARRAADDGSGRRRTRIRNGGLGER